MELRLGILTSVGLRHRYFANRLREAFNVVAIGYEETGYAPERIDTSDLTPHEQRIVDDHFAERTRQEQHFFGALSNFIETEHDCATRRIPPGKLNTDDTLGFLKAGNVSALAVYGTSLVRSPLLDEWPGRMINLHLGLSPYYRGTATNFYPLLNEEPQYVGATIHLLDAGIDSGPILRHARPTIEAEDRPHTIGCKAIQVGTDAMIAVLHDLETDRLRPVPQWPVDHPRLYLRKDYHPRQVVELYRKLEAGLIPRYASLPSDAKPSIRLVE